MIQPIVIENRLYNPEYSLGNMAEFHDYFKTFAPFFLAGDQGLDRKSWRMIQMRRLRKFLARSVQPLSII